LAYTTPEPQLHGSTADPPNPPPGSDDNEAGSAVRFFFFEPLFRPACSAVDERRPASRRTYDHFHPSSREVECSARGAGIVAETIDPVMRIGLLPLVVVTIAIDGVLERKSNDERPWSATVTLHDKKRIVRRTILGQKRGETEWNVGFVFLAIM
jgi:hypothetical protein